MSDLPLRYRFQKLMSSQRSSTAKDLANRFPTTPDCSPPAEIDGSSSRVPRFRRFQQGSDFSRLRMSGKELVWWFAKLLGELGPRKMDAQPRQAARTLPGWRWDRRHGRRSATFPEPAFIRAFGCQFAGFSFLVAQAVERFVRATCGL